MLEVWLTEKMEVGIAMSVVWGLPFSHSEGFCP